MTAPREINGGLVTAKQAPGERVPKDVVPVSRVVSFGMGGSPYERVLERFDVASDRVRSRCVGPVAGRISKRRRPSR